MGFIVNYAKDISCAGLMHICIVNNYMFILSALFLVCVIHNES